MASATFTLYADDAANNESAWLQNADICKSTWAAARECTTGLGYESSANFYTGTKLSGSDYIIRRMRLQFDVSEVRGTVTAATISLYCETIQQDVGSFGGIHIVSGADLDPSEMFGTDYYLLLDNNTSYGSMAVSALVEDAYNTITLNANGLTEINTYIAGGGGWVVLGVRPYDDFNNVEASDAREHQVEWGGDVGDYPAKLVLTTTADYYDDRVTGEVIREGPGYYEDELHLGGLSTSWRLVDLQRQPTPAVPSEAAEPTAGPQVWSGPFWYEPDLNLIPPADRARAAAEGGYWFWIVDGQVTRNPPAEYWEYFR